MADDWRVILYLFLCRNRSGSNKLLLTRLVAAYQIAKALSYFHQLNIIYRDLKPENIGFDVRGDIKIFDLGFAKEIRREEMLPEGTFKLTGRIGSLRYMVSSLILHNTTGFDPTVIYYCMRFLSSVF